MASIKVKFRPSTVAEREGTIYYQIIHDRKVRQIVSAYHVMPSEWDERKSMVVADQKGDRRALVMSIRECIRWDVERIMKIVHDKDIGGIEYTADDVIEEFVRYSEECSLFNYMESIIIKLRHNGKERTSETYKTTLNSFKTFRNDKDIMLDRLNSDIMEEYEAWQMKRGITLNTISFYTRILRAVYNRAVEHEIIEDRNPFRHVYTGVGKTVKRALPLGVIKDIKTLDLSANSTLDYARDMFILSFYLRGMSFIDMAFLRKSDLNNGYVSYRRRKTGQRLTIEWTPEMQATLDKYPENASHFLLPIITSSESNERNAYRNACYNVNHNLKKIAEMLNIKCRLTMYVARHSWASAAKSKGIPVSVISEGMGHESEYTTQIYLASLDTSVVDHANSIIIESLK